MQSAAQRAASVMLQAQSVIAVAIIDMAEAFCTSYDAFLCMYPCRCDVPSLITFLQSTQGGTITVI